MNTVKRFFSRALIACSFLSFFAAFSLSTSASAQSVAEDPDVQAQIRLFSAWLDGQLEYKELPGVVVGVVADQDLVWAQGFGYADIESRQPMQADTRFRMASHSKLFTATSIMQLREEGKLRLDDPVVDHLPWLEYKPASPEDPPITIEHLLTHSSGLQREANFHWTDLDFPTYDELRELLPERQAAYSPEVRWKYSNLAYTIAGMIVEEVAEKSWAEYLQENIFNVLEMGSSSVDIPDPMMATGYTVRMPGEERTAIPFVDARSMASATGLTSTVEDMAKFVSAQFREGRRGSDRLLSTASLREMHRVRMLETTWASGQGIGFSVSRRDGKLYVGHNGSYPGYTTSTSIQLDSKVGVIVLTNTNDSNPGLIGRELMDSVGQAVMRATQAETEVVAWDPAWARFVGRYRDGSRVRNIVLMNESLVSMNPWSPTMGTPSKLEPLGDGEFKLSIPTGGGPIGEIVRFVEEDGAVTRMIVGDTYSERVLD